MQNGSRLFPKTMLFWKRMFDEGQLNAAQRAFWEPKPHEELYDLQADRWEVNNLVDSPAIGINFDTGNGVAP